MFLLILLLLLFITSLLSTGPNAAKSRTASILLAAVALLWVLYNSLFEFAAAAVSGFTQSRETHLLTFCFRTFGLVPYCLWVALTASSKRALAKARRWDRWMHFVYAPLYWLLSFFPPFVIARLVFQDDRVLALNSLATVAFENGAMILCLVLCWYQVTNLKV